MTRRISRSLSASAAGARPSASIRARTKRSIGLRGQAACLTAGAGGATGGRNDQCACQSAPCSIQRLRTSISSADSVRPSDSGWHALGRVLGGDPSIELALLEVSRHDGPCPRFGLAEGAVLRVESEAGLAVAGIGPVALETLVRQDRTDLEVEIHLPRGSRLAAGREGRTEPSVGRKLETGDQDECSCCRDEARWSKAHPDLSAAGARGGLSAGDLPSIILGRPVDPKDNSPRR